MILTKLQLKAHLLSLSDSHRAVFGISCCERLLPNYERFVADEHWGDAQVLRMSMDYIWDAIRENSVDAVRIKALANRCESIFPDTEEFSSVFTSGALDAGSAIVELLRFFVDRSLQRILNISELSFDTVDMYIQDLLDIDYSEADYETKISAHPLMVREIETQIEDLITLKNNPVIDEELIDRFRNQKSNIAM